MNYYIFSLLFAGAYLVYLCTHCDVLNAPEKICICILFVACGWFLAPFVPLFVGISWISQTVHDNTTQLGAGQKIDV